MQSYYFYQHPTAQHTYVQKQPIAEQEAEFIWVECSRDDVVNRAVFLFIFLNYPVFKNYKFLNPPLQRRGIL